MGSVALTLRVLADTSQASGELRQLGNSADDMGSRLGKAAAVAAGFAAVGAGIMKAVSAASALEQASGGVEAVFKSGAGAVKEWAAAAATSIGLSKAQYMDLATLIGSQLKNAGVSMDQLGSSTNNLIQQGADLAAMFGGTTADAVDAISAALKGERDPIEKYGITLTEASVQAEILAMGLDTSTTAAQQNAKAMATMSLITKQGADAWGAAAREQDSFASVQQQLNAVFENTMAALGSALLPALSELGQVFSQLAPMIGLVLAPLAELVGWVLDLPQPLLAAAAAFAAWQIMGGLSAITAALSTAVEFLTANVKRLWASLGPIGIIALGVGIALAFLMDRSNDAKQAQEAQAQSAEALKATLDATTGAITEQTRAYVVNQAQSNGMLSTLERLGVDTSAYTDAAVGAAGGAERLGAAIDSASQRVLQSSDAYREVESALKAAGVSQDAFIAAATSGDVSAIRAQVQTYAESVAAASGNMSDAQAIMSNFDAAVAGTGPDLQALSNAQLLAGQTAGDLGGATEEAAQKARAMGGDAAAAAAAVQQQAEASAKAATEASKVASEQTAVSAAMREAEAATAAATRAADAFGLAMDQLAGRNITAEQAALALNNGMRGLSEAFAGAADKGGYSVDALASWNVAALTATEGGAALYGALNDVRSGYDASVASAYQQAAATGSSADAMAAGRAAADAAYQSFMTLATGAGLSGEQAAQLAAKLGIVAGTDIPDKTFELIAQDQQAQTAVTTAQSATIDSKTFDVNAIITPAQGALTSLTGMPLKNTVAVDANTGQATGQITNLTGTKYQTTVQTTADTNQAQSTLQGFTSAQRSTQVAVQANTTAAQDAITALVNQRRTLTITVEANTAPAQSAINGIQGKTVTVTVNTQQNITQTVTTVPAPAAALATEAPTLAAAPALSPTALAAESAPPPMRNLARQRDTDTEGGGGTTYVINVSGGLDSADSIARRVETLLRQRERRNYGVSVGPVPR